MARPTITARRDEAVSLTAVIHDKDPHPVYVFEIRDAAGHVCTSVSVAAKEPIESIPLIVAPGILSNGNYNLVIRGGDREIAAYPFTMEVR